MIRTPCLSIKEKGSPALPFPGRQGCRERKFLSVPGDEKLELLSPPA